MSTTIPMNKFLCLFWCLEVLSSGVALRCCCAACQSLLSMSYCSSCHWCWEVFMDLVSWLLAESTQLLQRALCKSNQHCWTLLTLACALWRGWKGCSWGVLLVFNTKDDLTTMMVVSCSLLASAAFLACVWYWRETPTPLKDWGQWAGSAGDSSSLLVLRKVKKSTSECNFYLILCYYFLKCHGLAGDGEGMCPPGWLLALGGKDGYDG